MDLLWLEWRAHPYTAQLLSHFRAEVEERTAALLLSEPGLTELEIRKQIARINTINSALQCLTKPLTPQSTQQ